MDRRLIAAVGMILLTGCAAPPTPEERAEVKLSQKDRRAAFAARMDESVTRLQVPLNECVSFLETGSFDAAKLIATGFEPKEYTLGSGTVYTFPRPGKYDLEVNMVDSGITNQTKRCTVTGMPVDTLILPALAGMGFERSGEASRKAIRLSRGDLDLEMTGVYYSNRYNRSLRSPNYYTLRRAPE